MSYESGYIDEFLDRRARQADANPMFLKALERERFGYRQKHVPDRMIWNRQEPTNGKDRKYATEFRETREAFAETLRVNREPCGWCGVRADIGCHHSRGQL